MPLSLWIHYGCNPVWDTLWDHFEVAIRFLMEGGVYYFENKNSLLLKFEKNSLLTAFHYGYVVVCFLPFIELLYIILVGLR